MPGRYTQTIADLLSQQGEIAARGAAASGQIWGNAVGNLGQIAGGAVRDYGVQQQEKQKVEAQAKRDQAFGAFVDSGIWATDPVAAVKESVKIFGPEGVKIGEGLIGASKLMQAKDKPLDPKNAQEALGMIARGWLAAPDSLKPGLYGSARKLLIDAGMGTPETIPEQVTPEFLPMIQQMAAQGAEAAPKTRQVEVTNPDGTKTIQIVEDKPGQTFSSAAIPEKSPVDVEGRMIRAEERKAERETVKAEQKAIADAAKAEQKAEAAKKETDDQVASAFAAMDTALKEVEKYAGTKAVTSPLEAKNARQQYESAAKAFAATLSRATGDSRISDLDRKAYADLVAYSGIGSGAIEILRPDLVRKRFNQAKAQFDSASKARSGGGEAGMPAVGEQRTINGKLAQWDGKGWLEVGGQ